MLPSRAVKLGPVKSNKYKPSTLLILKKQPFYIVLISPSPTCKGQFFDALGRPISKCDTARLYNKNHKLFTNPVTVVLGV